MEFYVYVALLTLAFALLTFGVWLKTKSVAFMVGAFFLYYWSLFGSWNIITSLLTGENTPYLFNKLFPVFLDVDYRNALLLYGLFICTVMTTVLYVARPARCRLRPPELIEISHWKAIFLGCGCGLFGYLLIRSTISTASEMGYGAVGNAPGYTFFQVLNHGALSIIAIGLGTYMSADRARFIVGRRNGLALMAYLSVLGALILFMIRVGNRGEVALTVVLLLLFYMANTIRPNKRLLAATSGVGLVAVMAVKLVRDRTFDGMAGFDLLTVLIRTKEELLQSTESIAAHLSMYGALHKHLPMTGGLSFVSLLLSVVPRALWADRPATVYEYYATSVGAVEGQGYTIHHATGWYLNFGVPGVICGAILIGWCWATLNNLLYAGKRRPVFSNAFAITGFWTFTSSLPDLLRAGPEVYKTTVFSQLLFPALLVVICSSAVVLHDHRPVMVFRRRIARRVHPRGAPERALATAGVSR